MPVIATRRRAGSRRSARARFVAGFLMSCASSSSSRSQSIERERLDVARGDVVRRDDDVDRVRLRRERRRRRAARCRDARCTRSDGANRCDLGAPTAVTTLIGQTTSVGPSASAPGSSRSEASIAIACTVFPRPMSSARIAPTPRSPSIRSQPWPRSWNGNSVERHRRRRRQRAEAARRSPSSSASERVERHLAELEPCLVGVEARDGAHELDDPDAAAAALEEAERASRRPTARSACQRPATRTNGSFAAASSSELLLAEHDVADGEPPVEARERRRREQAARARRRGRCSSRSGSTRIAARRAQPRRRQQHRHAALLEQRHRLAQEVAGASRRRAPPRSARASSNPIPCSASSGSSSAAGGSSPRAGRWRAGTRRRRRRPPRERRRQAERRVVLRLQPQLEHERLVAGAARRGGGRASTTRPEPRARPVVDPAREPPLQRRVAGVRAAAPIGRRQARRGTARAPTAGRRTCAEAARPSARSRSRAIWSTSDRVEVVHGRVAVAVERVGADGRQRRRDPGERRLHVASSVAPQNACQPAAAVVEVRMHEPFGDGAVRELDDREHGARAPASSRPPAGRRRGRPARARSRRRAAIAAASARSATAGSRRSASADSVPSAARMKAKAVGSCCQTISRVGEAVLGRSSVVGWVDTDLSE